MSRLNVASRRPGRLRVGDVVEHDDGEGGPRLRARIRALSPSDFDLELIADPPGSGGVLGAHIPYVAMPYRRFADRTGTATCYGERRMREVLIDHARHTGVL